VKERAFGYQKYELAGTWSLLGYADGGHVVHIGQTSLRVSEIFIASSRPGSGSAALLPSLGDGRSWERWNL
jgi:hypothetical protein